MSYFNSVVYTDGPTTDAFSRLRVSSPRAIFDAQMTYDLQPLLLEPVVTGTGASITHDATNRCALLAFSSTPTGGKSYLQSYEYFRYQPGKSQVIFATFNMIETMANTLKFVGYSDGTNGVEFQLNGTTKQLVVYSASSAGNETVAQSSWNLDKLDGTGSSGLTLDITKAQILVIDFQALYVGRVRVGFDIGGQVIYVHQFNHANLIASPYIQSANLPIRAGMTCTGTVSTTMNVICSAVIAEGGIDDTYGFSFAAEGTATAGNGSRVHILSVRPKTTFNSITNRTRLNLSSVEILVTGNSPVLWELCVGQAISGTTTFTDVNASYSAFEYNTAGTISGSPAIVIASGYIASSTGTKGSLSQQLSSRYPISLNQAAAVRANGTLSLLVTGVGGTSATRASLNWSETR